MDPIEHFKQERKHILNVQESNDVLNHHSCNFLSESAKTKYSYSFDWLGRPIIQYPQDIVALQQIIFQTNPDLIVETGVAHGGSLILSASIFALLDLKDGILPGSKESKRKVVGIDIDIRKHNLSAIKSHFLSSYIILIEGSSIDGATIGKVKSISSNHERIQVVLDSNHTHDHVKKELEAYSPMVTPGNYCIVMDTLIENVDSNTYPDRPWGKGDNPLTAVRSFLDKDDTFVVDKNVDSSLLISVAKEGYLLKSSAGTGARGESVVNP